MDEAQASATASSDSVSCPRPESQLDSPSYLQEPDSSLVDSLCNWIEKHGWLCLAALLVVFAISILAVNASRPLWFDETFTMNLATQPNLHDMWRGMPMDGNPPLEPLLVYLGVHIFRSDRTRHPATGNHRLRSGHRICVFYLPAPAWSSFPDSSVYSCSVLVPVGTGIRYRRQALWARSDVCLPGLFGPGRKAPLTYCAPTAGKSG